MIKFFFSPNAILFLGLFNSPVFLTGQTAGTPDLSFGQAGQVIIQDPINTYYGGPTVLLPDGKLIIAGYQYDQNGGDGVLVLTRLSPDGSLDLTYGTNGKAYPALNTGFDGGLYKMALTAEGKLIVVGTVVNDTMAAAFVARLHSNGELDAGFGQNGVIIFDIGSEEDEFWTVLIKPDGKILLGGSTFDMDIPGFYNLLLVQLFSDGTPDPDFGVGGIATADFAPGLEAILSLSIQADGKIVAVGANAVNDNDMEVVRFFPNGAIDSAFATNGAFIFDFSGREDVAYAGAVQVDQKIVFCGTSFKNGTSTGEATLFRLNTDGSFDPTFGTNGKVFTNLGVLEFARALVLQADGKILVGADCIQSASSFKGWLWVSRYNTDGSLDTSFGNNGNAQTPIYADAPESSELLIQPDGKIIQSGSADGKLVVWRYLNDQMVGLDEKLNVDFQLQLAPNVIAGQANLSWVLQSPSEVHCDLFDAQGRFLQTNITPTFYTSGRHEEALFFGNEVLPGTYFLKFIAGREHRIIKYIKI
ncbi:MAG: hypothetical protein H7246_22570 [Phycisphaerae bacterium]|nr:hypothetical protein [Saprospiraceae bacterium]